MPLQLEQNMYRKSEIGVILCRFTNRSNITARWTAVSVKPVRLSAFEIVRETALTKVAEIEHIFFRKNQGAAVLFWNFLISIDKSDLFLSGNMEKLSEMWKALVEAIYKVEPYFIFLWNFGMV